MTQGSASVKKTYPWRYPGIPSYSRLSPWGVTPFPSIAPVHRPSSSPFDIDPTLLEVVDAVYTTLSDSLCGMTSRPMTSVATSPSGNEDVATDAPSNADCDSSDDLGSTEPSCNSGIPRAPTHTPSKLDTRGWLTPPRGRLRLAFPPADSTPSLVGVSAVPYAFGDSSASDRRGGSALKGGQGGATLLEGSSTRARSYLYQSYDHRASRWHAIRC
ncbi:hypothetical protein GY45DRAFT_184464 [Cubamyces sp. BRFM 1775]|nr:hypothetical protein GY45DRAFT_184464 [Cubamyces sp. BRFM 1775]